MSDVQLDVLYELCWEAGGGLGKMTTKVKKSETCTFLTNTNHGSNKYSEKCAVT